MERPSFFILTTLFMACALAAPLNPAIRQQQSSIPSAQPSIVGPSPDPSASPVPLPSPDPSQSFVPTQTADPSLSFVPTQTADPSLSFVPSESSAPSVSASHSAPPTPSGSISAQPSTSASAGASVSASLSAAPSSSASITASATPSTTVSMTTSASVSASVSPSISVSASPGSSMTSTPSMTPSTSVSMSASASASVSASVSVSPSVSVSSSVTPSPGSSQSSAPSESATPSVGASESAGASASPVASGALPDPLVVQETPGAIRATSETSAVCFPGDASVMTENGVSKRMDELAIGDRVSVGGGKFSEVFMFTHKLSDVKYNFVAIETAAGPVIRLTEGHYLPLNGKYLPAREAKVGDLVNIADGTTSQVVEVTIVGGVGLFNPQTAQGDIIVDGVRASTYTTAVERQMAHALLAPLRFACRRLGVRTSMLEAGADSAAGVTSLFA